jgi:hypothetical protein
MKILRKIVVLVSVFLGLWTLNFTDQPQWIPVLVTPAEAVIGRPVSPGSVAGVARRTTRRAVAVGSASASASQQQQAQQQQQPAPQQAAGSPAAGTVVSALPPGCTSTVLDGVNLFNCSGVMYQPMFQSNNLVYVVK